MRSVQNELWDVLSKADSSLEDVVFEHDCMMSGGMRMHISLEWNGWAVLRCVA